MKFESSLDALVQIDNALIELSDLLYDAKEQGYIKEFDDTYKKMLGKLYEIVLELL